jgi:hypothetical protein
MSALKLGIYCPLHTGDLSCMDAFGTWAKELALFASMKKCG